MPSYWVEFFEFIIDPDDLAERITCTKRDCEWYRIVDGSDLGEVIDWAYDHFVVKHDQ